jgi:predicted dehydrogenase
VYAHTPEIAAIGDYDTVAVVLSFPSGTLGIIDLSRNSTYGYDQRLEVRPPRFIEIEGSDVHVEMSSIPSLETNGYRSAHDAEANTHALYYRRCINK